MLGLLDLYGFEVAETTATGDASDRVTFLE